MNNVSVVFYDPSDGRILKSCSTNATSIEANRPVGASHMFADNVDIGTQYVLAGEIADRPAMALSALPGIIGIDEEFVVTGFPSGTECHHIDGISTIDDGSLEWESDVEGVFSFRCLAFPYQEEFFRVKVEA